MTNSYNETVNLAMGTIIGPLFIKGSPAAFATAREILWKKTLANEIKRIWESREHIKEPVQINLKFFVWRRRAEPDLDNLIKPCIDGIGSILFVRRRGGRNSVWNTEDKWVYKIIAEKIQVENENEEGIEIIIVKHA